MPRPLPAVALVADALGAAQVLDRGAQAFARGAARCASQELDRFTQAVARGAARCLLQVLDRCAQAVVRGKSSQVNTFPEAKSKTRSKQNKDMHKFSRVYSEREVPLPDLTSGGE